MSNLTPITDEKTLFAHFQATLETDCRFVNVARASGAENLGFDFESDLISDSKISSH